MLATLGSPKVVFSTHFDCVPPFFPSRVESDRIYGRGAVTPRAFWRRRLPPSNAFAGEGETRVGLLFVVGEERGSDGARVANATASGCQFLVDGEPTDLRLGIATRGLLRLRLRATGRAAHSSFPELGESAIDKLIDALVALRAIRLPEDSRSDAPTTPSV